MEKFLLIFVTLLFFSSAEAADLYKIDPNHASINWSANHFGFSNPSGKFSDVEGTINFDEEHPQKSSVNITIKTKSVSTGLEKFNEHLKSSDFLDVEKFPTAKFISSAVTPIGKNGGQVRGNLTLLGISKMITLDIKINKIGINPITQKKTVGIHASTTLKRSDFKMDFGLPGISDNVKINIEIEGILVSSDSTAQNTNAAASKKSAIAPISEWKIISEKSSLEFKALQDNSSIKGSFKKFNGQILFDKNQLTKSKITIDIDTSSVSAPFTEALETLKNSSWLSTQAFPKATFRAEKFIALPNVNTFRADGNLTIKGKTIPTSLEFSLENYSETNARAVGNAIIKRSSFGIGDRDPKKANGVRDDVEIYFTVEAEK